MKKVATLFLVLILSFSVLAGMTYAVGYDFSKLDDTELTELYKQVRDEMLSRGLPISDYITLRDGKYIVGDDLLPGIYTITCTATEGESLGSMYSALGDMYKSIDDKDGVGSLMGTLGGMMESVAPMKVEILGDYGTVIKSFEMKNGDVQTITLTEKTAIQITGGSCTLEKEPDLDSVKK